MYLRLYHGRVDPDQEMDDWGFDGPTFGPLSLDLGAIYYWYPRERQHLTSIPQFAPYFTYPNGNATLRQTDFWEVYFKGTWEVIKDRFWLGFNEYYSPSWLNTGAYGNFFSGTAKFAGPAFRMGMFGVDEVGWYVSGEVGHYWLGTTSVVLLRSAIDKGYTTQEKALATFGTAFLTSGAYWWGFSDNLPTCVIKYIPLHTPAVVMSINADIADINAKHRPGAGFSPLPG